MNGVRIVGLCYDLLPYQVLYCPQNQRILHNLVVHILLVTCLKSSAFLACQINTPIGRPLHALYILGIIEDPLIILAYHIDCLLHQLVLRSEVIPKWP